DLAAGRLRHSRRRADHGRLRRLLPAATARSSRGRFVSDWTGAFALNFAPGARLVSSRSGAAGTGTLACSVASCGREPAVQWPSEYSSSTVSPDEWLRGKKMSPSQ